MAWVQISFEVGVADFKGAQKREYQKKSVIKYLFSLSMTSRLIIVAVIILLVVLTPTWFAEDSPDFLVLVETGLALLAYAVFRRDAHLRSWSNIILWNALVFYLITVVVEQYPYNAVVLRPALILDLQLQIPKSVGYAIQLINGGQLLLSSILSLALIVRAIECSPMLFRKG